MKQWIQRRITWIDAQFIGPPTLSQTAAAASLRASSGKVYYTLDGSDPRLPGGAVSSQARPYASPIPVNETLKIFARAHHRNAWSSPTVATFPAARAPQSGK
jgi:hypothetical protein